MSKHHYIRSVHLCVCVCVCVYVCAFDLGVCVCVCAFVCHPMGHVAKCRHPGGDWRAAYGSPAKAKTVAMAWPCAEDVRPLIPEASAEMPSTREAEKTR